MALTKIKLNTMVTGTLPDANIPDDITIDTAAAAPASGLTGNTLASGVTASSLTSVGTSLGIGTNNPSAKLDISGDTSSWAGMAKIYLTDVNSNSSSRNWSIGNGGTAYGALSFIVSNAEDGVPADSTGTAVMSMDGVNKRVGIGVASPKEKLEVGGDIANWRLYSKTGVVNGALSFNSYYNGSAWVHDDDSKVSMNMYMSDSRDNLEFSVRAGGATAGAGSTQMVISSAGRVGIGTDSPGYLTELRVNDTTVDTPRLVIRQLGTGDSSLAFQTPDSPYGFVMGVDNSDSERFKISTGVGDVGGSGEKMSIDPNGMITFTNSSARWNFYANSDTDLNMYFAGHDTSDVIRIAAGIGVVTSAQSSACDGQLTFSTSTGNNPTERMRINSSGFVGIGDTTSANALLDINKSTSSTDLPTANESFEGYRLILANPQLTNNATNALGFSMYNGEVCAYIATQTHYNGQYETDIIFGTRDDNRDDGIDDTVGDGLKEAFRIDHDSNIQFHGNMFGGGSKDAAPWNDSSGNGHLYYQKGTSALGATLALSTNVDVGGGYAGMYINLVNASASGDRMIAFGMDGSSAGQIHYSSSNQVAYATSGSDKRLKKNITNWTGDTLSKFANIEPKMFHWKTQDSSEDKIKGFIAQDMIENFPEAYPLGKMGEGDDQIERYQYNPSGMVIYLMKALKEQVAVNADLTSRIEALENA